MSILDKGPLEAQASTPQVELTRYVQDLSDNQLWEVLETLQTETVWRERAVTLLVSPWGNLRAPGGGSGAIMADRDVDPQWERGWQYGEPMQQPKSPLNPLQMLADSLACSQPG